MHVSTLVRWGAVLTVVGVAVTACSDAPSAPSARPRFSAQPSEAWLLANGGPSRAGRGRSNKQNDVNSQDFVVDPTQSTTIRAGDHEVTFPANSICDPASSGYGEDRWDAPCEPLQTPIKVTATWTSKYGHAFVQFEPALRFVPTDDPSQFVRLSMKDYYDLDPNYSYPIFWQRPADGTWVNESLSDPSLGSLKDERGNRVSRRLKHFSSYFIGAGESCDAWSSLECLPLIEFSGWMVGAG
jgi:hypothetical protein